MAKVKGPPVVSVEWIDSATTSGWSHDTGYRPNLRCTSIGYLVSEDDKVVRISHSASYDQNESADCFCDAITIPKLAIKRRKRVRV